MQQGWAHWHKARESCEQLVGAAQLKGGVAPPGGGRGCGVTVGMQLHTSGRLLLTGSCLEINISGFGAHLVPAELARNVATQ